MRVALPLLLLLLLGLVVDGSDALAGTSVRELVDDLGGTDARARGAAYRELVKRRDPAALPLLRKAMPTWEHTGQYYGVLVLERYPRREVRSTWRRLFRCASPFVRVWTGMALHRAGEKDVVDGIVEALADEGASHVARTRMVSRLGWPKDERLRDAVRDQLRVGAPVSLLVQIAARLHRFRDRAAIVRLRALALDPRPGVRALAAAWLYDAGELRQAQVLATQLKNGIPYAEFKQVAQMLAANRRVDDAILDAVVARLADEKNVTLLLQQIAFLGQHRHAKARGALRKLLLHANERVSRAAFDVLVRLTGRLREETIGPLLDGNDIDKRLWAAEALRQRDDRRGLAVAVDVLGTGTVPQRVGAAALVASFVTDEAVEPLLDALEDPHLDVRRAALGGLSRLLGRLLPYRVLKLTSTGYAADADAPARAAALETLRAWWRSVRSEDW